MSTFKPIFGQPSLNAPQTAPRASTSTSTTPDKTVTVTVTNQNGETSVRRSLNPLFSLLCSNDFRDSSPRGTKRSNAQVESSSESLGPSAKRAAVGGRGMKEAKENVNNSMGVQSPTVKREVDTEMVNAFLSTVNVNPSSLKERKPGFTRIKTLSEARVPMSPLPELMYPSAKEIVGASFEDKIPTVKKEVDTEMVDAFLSTVNMNPSSLKKRKPGFTRIEILSDARVPMNTLPELMYPSVKENVGALLGVTSPIIKKEVDTEMVDAFLLTVNTSSSSVERKVASTNLIQSPTIKKEIDSDNPTEIPILELPSPREATPDVPGQFGGVDDFAEIVIVDVAPEPSVHPIQERVPFTFVKEPSAFGLSRSIKAASAATTCSSVENVPVHNAAPEVSGKQSPAVLNLVESQTQVRRERPSITTCAPVNPLQSVIKAQPAAPSRVTVPVVVQTQSTGASQGGVEETGVISHLRGDVLQSRIKAPKNRITPANALQSQIKAELVAAMSAQSGGTGSDSGLAVVQGTGASQGGARKPSVTTLAPVYVLQSRVKAEPAAVTPAPSGGTTSISGIAVLQTQTCQGSGARKPSITTLAPIYALQSQIKAHPIPTSTPPQTVAPISNPAGVQSGIGQHSATTRAPADTLQSQNKTPSAIAAPVLPQVMAPISYSLVVHNQTHQGCTLATRPLNLGPGGQQTQTSPLTGIMSLISHSLQIKPWPPYGATFSPQDTLIRRRSIPPSIQGIDKHTLFEYVDPICHDVWRNHFHKDHFWVLIGDDRGSNSNAFSLFKSEFVVDILHEVVDDDEVDFLAIPATLSVPRNLQFKVPHPILVTGGSAEITRELVKKKYIDTEWGWLTIFPPDMPTSNFIMYLRAPLRDSPENRKEIQDAVRNRLRASKEFCDFVHMKCDDSRIVKLPRKQWVDFILSHIHAAPLDEITENGVPVMLWRIYMHPITTDPTLHWTVLVAELRKMKFAGSTWVAESVRDPGAYRCNRCKGLDHPTGMCPINGCVGYWRRAMTDNGRRL